MKKFAVVLLIVAFMAVCSANAIAGNGPKRGPAPNSGDCIPDGSGFDELDELEIYLGQGHVGPAPNSGDCVPDGPGW